MAIDNGTAAIIGICVALGVTLLALLIFLIMYCRLRIEDDSNVRKRILARESTGYVDEVKTQVINEEEEYLPPPPRQVAVPAPMPVPVPVRQPSPPPPQQPEVVVHEVVHRYDPAPPPPAPVAAPMAQSRLVRRNSWSGCHHHCNPHHGNRSSGDEWVMIKKRQKRGSKSRRRDSDSSSSSSSSSDDEDDSRRRGRPQFNIARLAPYDLAMPRPMGAMGAATYMVGGPRPVYGMAPTMPMASAAMPMASSFQPTYGIVPMM